MHQTTAEELFERVQFILDHEGIEPKHAYKIIHETLEQTCYEALKNTHEVFGNLFSKVDYLCRKSNISAKDTFNIQQMRRQSNNAEDNTGETLKEDCRALCIFISATSGQAIPDGIVGKIPADTPTRQTYAHIDYKYIRCIIEDFDEKQIHAVIDQETEHRNIVIDYQDEHVKRMLDKPWKGMQLNLLDCSCIEKDKEKITVVPKIIVVEPDYLIDISSIARCFTDYGHHPYAYIVNQMAPVALTQPILLGNYAGAALDDIVNKGTDYKWTDTLIKNFKDRAIDYCTCEKFNQSAFKNDARNQARNIEEIVSELFQETEQRYERRNTILEPSFICEQLGLQGRVDMMTTDMKLLVEQKSGSNFNIQTKRPNKYGSFQKEEHYVQLLLYYGVLQRNFNLRKGQLDAKLLYSKYPLPGGLVRVNFYQGLFHEAIALRNKIAATEYEIAKKGFESIIDDLSVQTINENKIDTEFFKKYILPQLNTIINPLHKMSDVERAYFCEMTTFVYREQLASKIGIREGVGNSISNLWNMPLEEKKDTGNIYTELNIIDKQQSDGTNGFDMLTLEIPKQEDDFLPNFRAGDMICLYAYEEWPDIRKSIIFKGTIVSLDTKQITIHLNDGQQNHELFDLPENQHYAIEHGGTDVGSKACIRGLHHFITAPKERRDLLLAQREPRTDKTIKLTKSYHPSYDQIILKAKQAQDYFLLIGPPGTGKTSMALQFMVRELGQSQTLLLMSYTNRAVDEICDMLSNNDIEFLRIGSKYSCAPKFRKHLIEEVIGEIGKLEPIKERIEKARIVVGTTSTMMARPNLFKLKHFNTAIIDEAGQILEPNLMGLLAAHEGQQLKIDKFILIGDHKQLPAVVQQDETQSKVRNKLLNEIGIENCGESLFERLVKNERKHNRTELIGILNKQGRMHPEIAQFPATMFYQKENLQPVPVTHQKEGRLNYGKGTETPLENLLRNNRAIFIASKNCRQPNLSDKVNTHEAELVATISRYIHQFYGDKFDANKTIGIIVPYRNQIAMIRREMAKLNIAELNDISIDTVERYQGSQRDVIVYSLTIQSPYQLDFLTENTFEEEGCIIDRKLNVAMTRARKQLILVGNKQTMCKNTIFKKLIEHIKEGGGYYEPAST